MGRVSADLLKRLADAGTPMELIMEVAETLAEARAAERILDKRREKDRERKRNSKDSAESAEVQGTVGMGFPDKEKSPRPPKEINPSHVCETGARGWHRLPADWSPRPLPQPVQAKVDQWPPGAFEDEIASFRRWAANAENKNGKGKKLDWDQAFRNWITRQHNDRHQHSKYSSIGKSAAAFAALNPSDDRPM